MKLIKYVTIFITLFYVSACAASSQKYLDCEWTIPSSFNQISQQYYHNDFDDANIEDWQPGSILFTSYNGTEQDNYQEIQDESQKDVLMLQHQSASHDKYLYVSIYLRESSFGRMLTQAGLWIIQHDKAISISGLNKKDAITLTSGCAEFSQIEKHYDVLEQVKNGFSEFLQTDHGMDVLVPKAE